MLGATTLIVQERNGPLPNFVSIHIHRSFMTCVGVNFCKKLYNIHNEYLSRVKFISVQLLTIGKVIFIEKAS